MKMNIVTRWALPLVLAAFGLVVTACEPMSLKTAIVNEVATTLAQNNPAPLPTFSPLSGTYAGDQLVTITSSLAGATIYYSVDPALPSTSSARYNAPISISGNGTTKTIHAIVVKSGYKTSDVATATYTIDTSAGVGSTTVQSSSPADLSTVGPTTAKTIDVTFSSAVTGATNTASYHLSGSALSGATVQTATSLGGNTYQITLQGTLVSGTLILSFPGVMGNGSVAVSSTRTFTIDATPPTYTIVASDAAFPHVLKTGVVVTFSKAVTGAATPANYTLSGAAQGTLAVTGATDDGSHKVYTLTFSGLPTASQGSVVVTAASAIVDSVSNSPVQAGVSLAYDPNWYVSTAGNDSNIGSKSAPHLTIEHALAAVKALTLTSPVDIRIQNGTYNLAATSSKVDLDTGTSGFINLVGSYDSTYNRTANGSAIVIGHNTSSFYTVTMVRTSGVIDGLTLKFEDNATENVGIVLSQAGATVRNSIILGTTTGAATAAHYGIVSNVGTSDTVYSVSESDMSGVKIYNNVILPGGNSATTNTVAIKVVGTGAGTAPWIANNLIDSGTATSTAETYGLWSYYSGVIVENNLFYSFAATNKNAGIRVSDIPGTSDRQLKLLRNNAFQLNASANLLLRAGATYTSANWGSVTNFTQEQFGGGGYAFGQTFAYLGNVDLTGAATLLSFVNATSNWRLNTPPTSTTIASFDASDPIVGSSITTNADGIARGTTNWQMGPY